MVSSEFINVELVAFIPVSVVLETVTSVRYTLVRLIGAVVVEFISVEVPLIPRRLAAEILGKYDA